MFLSCLFFVWLVVCVLGSTPGIDTVIQLLFDSPGTNYPTSFTRDIIPVTAARDVPLYMALSYGVISVEADVWLIDDELYIGHELQSLTPNRTFTGLYVQPLVDILANANPVTTFTQQGKAPVGVFDRDGGQTLYLFVDIKTNGPQTLQKVIEQLNPLRQKNYLTKVEGTALTQGPITVIGTGNTPLNDVLSQSLRDVFFDGPLGALNATFTPSVSPIVSGDFAALVGWDGKSALTDGIRQKISSTVGAAHQLGVKTRFWNTPLYPIFARNAVWRVLLELGSDILNADDLKSASEF